MTKRATKKTVSLFCALVICLSFLPCFALTGFAADGIEMRLEKLKSEFPDGYYWNHRVTGESDKIQNILTRLDESYADSVTSYPCTDHDYGAGRGDYDCNYFDEGYQCHGFAAQLFYRIFGVRQSTLPEIDRKLYEIQPGDLVRLRRNTHSAIVLSVDGLRFTVAECNVSDVGEVPSCEISWGRTCSITDITYYVHAPNYEQIKNDTNWKSLESKSNQGNNFYSAIINSKSDKALTVEGSNVVLKTYTGQANQMWLFSRLSNGSYKITSCLNGLALDLEGGVSNNRANVGVRGYEEGNGQKWAIYGSGKRLFISADCSRSVLCCEGGVYADGTNILVTEKIDHAAQIFSLKKRNGPSASQITATGAVNKVSLSWTKSADTSSYTVEVYRDGKIYKSYKNVTVNSGTVSLPAGNYYVKIYSNNTFAAKEGNTAYFTVSDNFVLGKTAKVTASQTTSSITLSWTAVPGATGYRIFYKSGDKWKTGATVTKTVHTFKNLPAGEKYTFAVRAYKHVDGKTTWADSYAEFTAGTKTNSPAKLTASQNESTIKLSWSAVKNAEGYDIYYKNDSSWILHSSTTSLSKTFKNLPSGKSYTFAVRPYIKTTLGTVKGEYKTLLTATKPEAPVISAEEVKNLSVKLLWKKVEGADGYQVYYKTEGKPYTLLNNLDSGKRGLAISQMKYGIRYTFAVRAYKKVDGGYIYGAHSEITVRAQYI